LFQDSRGYLWVGTHGGLSRFDGKYFKNWNREDGLPDEYTICFAETNNGEVLIGTRKGLVVFEGDEISVISEQGLEDGHIWGLQNDGEKVWMATSKGLFFYEDGTIAKVKTPFDLIEGGCRGLAGGGEFPIYVFSGGTIYSFTNGTQWDSIPNSPSSVIEMVVDHKGGLWVGNWSTEHVWHWDGKTSRNFDEFINSPITDIFEDSKHRIWASSWDAGIFIIDEGDVNNFSVEHGLASTSFWGVIEDDEGNSWFGSFGGGLYKFIEDPFVHYGQDEGLPSRVINSVYSDSQNRLWVGTDNGMAVGVLQDDQSIDWLHGPWVKQLAGKKIVSFYERKSGAIAIASYESDERFLMYDNGKLISWKDRINAPPFCFHETPEEVLWVGTDNRGFLKTGPKGDEQIEITHGGNRIINLMGDKKGNVWMATYRRGVNIAIGDSIHVFNEGLLKGLTVSKILPGFDEEHWVSTEDRGIYMVELDENNDLHIVDSLNKRNGSISNNVQGMRKDHLGRIWIGTSVGMMMIEEKDGERLIKKYGKNEGFTKVECSFDAFALIENNMFIGTSSGLSKMDLSKEEREPPVSRMALMDVQLNFESINLQSFGLLDEYNFPSQISFNYDQNHLTFIVNAIHLTKPDKVRYRFKMEGLDEKWSPLTKEGKITYSSIPHGEFNLKIECSIEGQTQVFAKEIIITIIPPFWKTGWFYVLVILIGGLMLYIIIKWRTAKLKQRQLELEQEVKIATKEIRQQKQEVEQQKDMIEEAHQEIKDSITYAKRIQSAILPPVKLVKEYLKESFIFYKPKDVVAGDFYWMESVIPSEISKNTIVLFAAADCTGHGVPGAMVSVICNNALNRSVRENGLTDPGEILTKTRDIVIQEFEKSEEDVKDGMDIALCSLEGNKLQYAGAHNPLWIIRKGEIIETKANKQPIGLVDNPVPYTTHSFDLEQGDSIYIFSDGYVDQFGGEKRKKFKAKAFRELLLSIQDKTMEEQKIIINDSFETWKGSLEQIDDVCIIGIRV
jgi:serine phosphatase RsbU (regulator of sigma subunit)/ligand-binding sensor domain-containing protein